MDPAHRHAAGATVMHRHPFESPDVPGVLEPPPQEIGHLLLRSDVCYAGTGYCVALARFNTRDSTGFLLEYLDYYLTRHDLWFDQGCAMGAIGYLDSRDGSNNLESLMEKWVAFA